MAKAVGLDAGEFEVKVVELDGSFRRPRLSRVIVEPVAEGSARAEDEAHAAREAEATHSALQDGGFSRDNLNMAFPCREAVLRQMTVPFVGEEQIRKVIKFEAEGSIHSHSVDDMVVDFHVLGQAETETRVLMAALPKVPLRTSLTALENVGIEPVTVDLDTMALYRVAEWCGAFDRPSGDGEGEPPGEDAQLPAASAPCSIVLDLGARSTRVLVAVSGELVDMRALRTGADSVSEEVAAAEGITVFEARDAVSESLRTDGDLDLVLLPDAEEESEPVDDEGSAKPTVRVASGVVVAARDRYLSRLRRELVRFMASTPSSIEVESVWVTGGASMLAGVEELLADVFGVEAKPLDVLGQLNHKLADDEAREMAPKIAVAVGLALHALGGKRGFNFRQEDLVFTKGFDRVKFPLAIACMLGLFLVLVIALRARRELTALERQYGAKYSVEEVTRRGRVLKTVLFNGYLGTLVNSSPRKGWFAIDKNYGAKDYTELMNDLLEAPIFTRLNELKTAVRRRFVALQQKSGYYPELRMGSGLGALVELAQVLHSLEDQLGRYQLLTLTLKLPAGTKGRFLGFEIALRSGPESDFRGKGDALVEAIRRASAGRDSAFLGVPDKDVREKFSFTGPDGGEGFVVSVKVELKPESQYPVFPK